MSKFDPHDEEMLRYYWQALGRFVFYYAYLEDAMQLTLRAVTRTPPKIGKALFSGVRVSTAISHIRRTYEARDASVPPLLEEAMQKAALVTSERDRILHHGINFSAWNKAFVTDQARQLEGRVRTTEMSIELLDDLNWDTQIVWARLIVFTRTLSRKKRHPHQEAWESAAQRPWRYKPPKPIPAPGKSRRTKQGQARQRKSSSE